MSSFDHRLTAATALANRDPAAGWACRSALVETVGKTEDLLHLGAWAVQVGGASLGRWADAIDLLDDLRRHPLADDDVKRSLWRGMAVLHLAAGDADATQHALGKGVTNESEACRFAGLAAQTLTIRGRLTEATEHLHRAAALARDLPPGDPVVTQTAVVVHNILTMARNHARGVHHLLEAGAAAAVAAEGRAADWQRRHIALWEGARATLLAGHPVQALHLAKNLMALEDAHDAGPLERSRTTALVCRAQATLGQHGPASGSLEAFRDFAHRAERLGADFSLELAELERLVDGLR